jgi:predicted phage baseplate assembly protein
LEAVAAGKDPYEPTTPDELERRDDVLARTIIGDGAVAQFYRTKVVSADPSEPAPTTVDVSAQVDGSLWIALVAKPAADVAELRDRIVSIGVAFDETVTPPRILPRLEEERNDRFHADELTSDPPPMLWRLWTGDAGSAFGELRVVGDTTRGLSTNGVVKIELPRTLPRYDRPVTGGTDSPPPLPDPRLTPRIVAWIQVSRPKTASIGDAIGSVRWVGVNAVQAVQARTATAELIGTGSGDSGQRCPLNQRPVLARSVSLQVEEPTGWTSWEEVDNFAASGPGDRHFVVDLDAGEISFGRARVPQIGERIRVLSYRYGGGAAGNLPAGAVDAFEGVAGVKVTHPLPATGGGDRVTLADAMDAIPAEVHRRDRAVTSDDFRDLAGQVAGVGRADTLSLFHPDTPGERAAGVVSMVIFPDADLRDPGAPLPELGLLRRVARHLDARRLITTELYVLPPEYVPISLSVGVRVRDGFQVDAVRRWVELILRQYLAPLPPYGPDGSGWTLGRAVRRAELEAVAVQVEGVEYLEDLLMGPAGGATATDDASVPLIPLERWQVPSLVQVTVVQGPPLPLGAAYEPDPPAQVPVLLPPDTC